MEPFARTPLATPENPTQRTTIVLTDNRCTDVPTAANCIGCEVVTLCGSREHVDRVLRIIERHGRAVVVRMLVSLEDGGASTEAMHAVVDHLGAVPVRRVVTAGASDQRVRYRLPDRRTLYAKSIRPVRLPETCSDCRFNNPDDCQEGYYGVRMYRAVDGPFMVGVCIQRMDLCMPRCG